MPPSATPSAERGSAWQTLGRHQVGAVAATAVDFGAMILCVQANLLGPVAATSVGATMGAITNFGLGRTWIFRSRSASVASQAGRYVGVSAASAGLNVLGEHLVHDGAHVQYVLARALVAFAVSLLWNFPMQRHFVFPEGKP